MKNNSINRRIISVKRSLESDKLRNSRFSSWAKTDITRDNSNAGSEFNQAWDNTWDQGPWNNHSNFTFNNWGNS